MHLFRIIVQVVPVVSYLKVLYIAFQDGGRKTSDQFRVTIKLWWNCRKAVKGNGMHCERLSYM